MKQLNPVRRDVGTFTSMCFIYTCAMFATSIVYQILLLAYHTLRYQGDFKRILSMTEKAIETDGLPYLLAVCVGLLIFALYRQGALFRSDLKTKQNKMTASTFFFFISLLFFVQFISAIFSQLVELFLNSMGLTILRGLEAASSGTESFTMFLYASFMGPISEELIFRGAGLRVFEKYGKVFAIVMTSILFGLFHANIPQFFFATLIGIGFAYITFEYSILWAMFFHIFNNLVISSALPALYSLWPEEVGNTIHTLLLLIGSSISLPLLIIKAPQIKAYIQANRSAPGTFRAAFRSVWFWFFMVIMVLLSFLFIRTLH